MLYIRVHLSRMMANWRGKEFLSNTSELRKKSKIPIVMIQISSNLIACIQFNCPSLSSLCCCRHLFSFHDKLKHCEWKQEKKEGKLISFQFISFHGRQIAIVLFLPSSSGTSPTLNFQAHHRSNKILLNPKDESERIAHSTLTLNIFLMM